MPETIGNRIRKLRQLAGITAVRLCSLAGLSKWTVGRIEAGATAPAGTTIAKIASVLGADTLYLITGEGEPPDEETVKRAVALAEEAQERTQGDAA